MVKKVTLTNSVTKDSIVIDSKDGYYIIDEIDWDTIKNANWIYVSSLSGDSNSILDALSEFAEENGVKLM